MAQSLESAAHKQAHARASTSIALGQAGTTDPSECLGPETPGPVAANHQVILALWSSLDWAKAAQVSTIIAVLGVALGLTLWGTGHLIQALFGAPTLWSAIGGAVTGTSTSAVAYRVGQRREQRRRNATATNRSR